MKLIVDNFVRQCKAFVLFGEPYNNHLILPIVFNFEKDRSSLSSSTFYTPWKYQETKGFLIFSGGIK